MKKDVKKNSEVSDEELSADEIRERRKAARKRRILRNRLIFLGILLLAVGAVAFRIFVVAKTVNVTNETPYSDEQLLASMDEGKGTFLFSFRADKIEEELKNAYPYVGSVEIKRHFPTTVDITFRRAERAYAFYSENHYVFTDANLRVLEISQEADSSVLTVIGADIGKYEKGKTIDSETFIYGDFISNLIAQSERTGIGRITKIDITKKYRIAFLLNDTVTVILGDFSNLDKKFDTLKYIVESNDKAAVATVNVKVYTRGKYSLGSDIFSSEQGAAPTASEPSQSGNSSADAVPTTEQGTGTSYDTDIEP